MMFYIPGLIYSLSEIKCGKQQDKANNNNNNKANNNNNNKN